MKFILRKLKVSPRTKRLSALDKHSLLIILVTGSKKKGELTDTQKADTIVNLKIKTHLVPNNQKFQQPPLSHGHPHLPKAWQGQNLRHEVLGFHQGVYCWTLYPDELSLDSSRDASMPNPVQSQMLFLDEHSSSRIVFLLHVLKEREGDIS